MSTTIAPEKDKSAYQVMGRLASLGVQKPWQAALYLPASHLDCSRAHESVDTADSGKAVRWLRIVSTPTMKLRERRQPMLMLRAEDRGGRVFKASAFGDPEQWQQALGLDKDVLVEFACKPFAGEDYLTLHRVLPAEWSGHLVPNYPLASTKIISQEQLRKKLLEWLPRSIPLATDHIRHQLQAIAPFEAILEACGAAGWSLDGLLEQVHRPLSPAHARGARNVLHRLAALGALHSAREARPGKEANPFAMPSLHQRLSQLPFTPTGDQHAAIGEVAELIRSGGRPIYHVVFGDVGSGKSAVMTVVAAAAADAGRRTVALFPTSILAQEQYAAFRRIFPDVRCALVTADHGDESALKAPVLFATSAALHRKLTAPDLLVVDEQHKWSRAQREQLAGPRTHVMEMSATCIPRSQALMRYGQITVSQLRQGHCRKSITTHLWEGKERAMALFGQIMQDVRNGHAVLMVYPKRKRTQDKVDRSNVYRGMEKWEDLFPGQVRTVTSDSSTQDVAEAIQAIRSGAAKLLISTTVIEVGVDIENLRRMVVVDPQRHGLSGLHQLRGRLARQGGEGQFHLVSNDRLPDATRERVRALMASTDGFALAEMDLRQRGPGDLRGNSKRQAGADGNFLIGQPVPLEVYDQMHVLLEELSAAHAGDRAVWRE